MNHLPWCPQNGGPGCGACSCPVPAPAHDLRDARRLADVVVETCPSYLVEAMIRRLERGPETGNDSGSVIARALEALRRARARAQRKQRRRPFAFAPKRRPDVR